MKLLRGLLKTREGRAGALMIGAGLLVVAALGFIRDVNTGILLVLFVIVGLLVGHIIGTAHYGSEIRRLSNQVERLAQKSETIDGAEVKR